MIPRSLVLTFLAATLLSGPPARAAAPTPELAVDATLDLRYYEGTGRQTLDVFAPRGEHNTPVVLFVHGGTWMFGDKDFFGLYRGVGLFLARHGVTAVLINYRLSPLVRHPEHVKDVARAYAWTYRNVARFGGDPSRIIVAGHSAGGHLAALLATDERYLKDPELRLDDRARQALKGVIAVSGVYRVPGPAEFHEMLGQIVRAYARQGWAAPVLMTVGEVANPFALVFGRQRDVQVDASPLTHVRPHLPPFLLLHAQMEVVGLADQASAFAKALEKAGVKVESAQIDDCSHRTILFHLDDPDDVAGRRILHFIDEVAGPRPRAGS